MVIRCPECATRFRIADHMIGEKPVKLKCSKCQHVFTHSREKPPEDEEPPRVEGPSHPRMPVVRPRGAKIGAPPPAGDEPAEPAGEQLQQQAPPARPSVPEMEDEFESFEGEEPAGPLDVDEEAPTREYQAAQETARPAEPEPEPEQAAPAQPAPAAPAAPAQPEHVSQPSFSETITLDEMLPQPEPPSRTGRLVGIVFVVGLGIIVLFSLFVVARNGWDVSTCTSDPVHAMRAAVGLAPRIIVDREARGLEASVLEAFKADTGDGRVVFVVSGEVLNTTIEHKTRVVVQVAIVNLQGVSVFEQETIAGTPLITRQEMADRTVLEIREQAEKDRKRAESRLVRSNGKAIFQAFFTTFPPGVENLSLYKTEVRVKDAQNAPD